MARKIRAEKFEQLPYVTPDKDIDYTTRQSDLTKKAVQALTPDVIKTYFDQATETFEQIFQLYGSCRIDGMRREQHTFGSYRAKYEFSDGGSVLMNLYFNSCLVEGILNNDRSAHFLFLGNDAFLNDENEMIQKVKDGLSELELSVTDDCVIDTNQDVLYIDSTVR